MDLITLNDIQVGGDFNLYLKNIDGIDGLQRINDYFLKHGSVERIYTELIDYFTKAEGYFSEHIKQVIVNIDNLLTEEREKTNNTKISISNTDDIGVALAFIKDNYKNDNKKLAYINYLQGCLLQIQFKYVQAYIFFQDACGLDENVKYYCATGELAIKLSKYKEAETYFKFVVDILRWDLSSRIKYIEALNNLGGALDQQYRFDEAISFYHAALFLLKEQNKNIESELYLGLVYNNLGGAFLALRSYEDAKKFLQLALSIREKNSATTNEIAITKNNLAEVFRLQNEMIKAENLLEQAKNALEKTYNNYPNHPTIALTLNNLGNLYLDLKKYDDSKKYFEQSLGILKYIFQNVGSRESTIIFYNLAITSWHSHKYKEALYYFKKALNESKDCLEANDPVCKVIKQDYDEFINQKKYKVSLLRYWFFK